MKDLPHVQRFKDRHGKVRLYYRRPGWPRVALPDPRKGLAAFLRAYEAAEKKKPLKGAAAGTLDALIVEYLRSKEWRELKPSSQETYMYVINFLRGREGINKPIASIRRRHILNTRDEVGEKTPAKANLVVKVISRLMAFAVDREYRDDNPAARIDQYKGGEHRSWTDDELAAFEARWLRGTMERRIYELALGTGQRRGDLATMTWADRQDGVIQVVQEKTGEKVWVPEHRSLRMELSTARVKHAVILHTVTGKAFTADYLGVVFADAIDEADLPDECVLHGLRKAATRRLAEAGCSEREIMSITGHKSPEMVTLYTKAADRKKMAKAAILKLEKGEK